jgi:dienelactone hydrolase
MSDLATSGDRTVEEVRERRFDLEVDGEVVPGVIWTPAGADGPRPKVLFGHGGIQHKRAPNIVALARDLVVTAGYAAVAIDAPGHGERVTAEQRERMRRRAATTAPADRRDRGRPGDPYLPFFLRGVREWRAVLDEIEGLPEIGPGPTGWWGVSMGTSIGLPLLATEPRFTCAVLGLASTVERPGHADYLGWARSLRLPLLFLCQRDDAGHPIAAALELYDLFGSEEKTLHVNPGPHVGVPVHEQLASRRFLVRHLGSAPSASGAGDFRPA